MTVVRQWPGEWSAPPEIGNRASWPRRRHGKGPLGACFIVGTWDDFEGFHEMAWNVAKEEYTLRVQMTEQEESFQILVGSKAWTRRLYPNFRDANPFMLHSVMGPSGGGHGMNWTIGRDPRELTKPGAWIRISLSCLAKLPKYKVSWSSLALADSMSNQPMLDCRDVEDVAETAYLSEEMLSKPTTSTDVVVIEPMASKTSKTSKTKVQDEVLPTAEEVQDESLPRTSKTKVQGEVLPIVEEVQDESLPTFVFSGPAIDVPSPSVEKLVGQERKLQVAQVQELLLDYENDAIFPRAEDAQFINREGYEVFLLTEAMTQVRSKLQNPATSSIGYKNGDGPPIVIVALMAVHITSEARLEKFRHTLLSIQDQVDPDGAEFVLGISWFASTPEFCDILHGLFESFQTEISCGTVGSKRRTCASSSYEMFCNKSKDNPALASPQGASAATVIVQQHQRHTQFQHIRAALDAVEEKLRGQWSVEPGAEPERSLWCIFGDDDDIWHPRRVVEFANAIKKHKLLSGVAAFASAARAEVAVAAQTGRMVAEEELPKTVSEVDAFLGTQWGVRRNNDPNCKAWMEHYGQAGVEAASLWTPGELALEYFDFCMRLRLLHEFFDVTGPQVIAHRFCDLRLDTFLITYPFMGREMGLELSWFDSGDVWMYFYANAGIDHDSVLKNVEEGADSDSFSIPNSGSSDVEHVSTSFPIRKAEQELAKQAYSQLKLYERSLTPGRLTKYLAAYRIALEVNLVRIHTRRIDQRTFDQVVFDSVLQSFGSFVDKIWARSPDLSSRPATRLFKVCQSFAKAMAKRFDVSVLWHFPDDYMMPDVQEAAQQLQMQHEATLGQVVEDRRPCEDLDSDLDPNELT